MNTLALTARMGIGDAGIAAVLGYAVVFFGLVLLMCVVIIMGKAMAGTRNKKADAPTPAAAAPAAPRRHQYLRLHLRREGPDRG